MSLIFIFFFFSSRRRHTRLVRDWSSDVCSSDLTSDDKKQIVQNQIQKIVTPRKTKNTEEMNRLTKDIFKNN